MSTATATASTTAPENSPLFLAAAHAVLVLIASVHFYIFLLESVLWKKRAVKVFRKHPDDVERTAVFAANQAVYNLMITFACFMTYLTRGERVSIISEGLHLTHIYLCFMCVWIVGLFGGITAAKKIYQVQALPALIGLSALLAHIHLAYPAKLFPLQSLYTFDDTLNQLPAAVTQFLGKQLFSHVLAATVIISAIVTLSFGAYMNDIFKNQKVTDYPRKNKDEKKAQ